MPTTKTFDICVICDNPIMENLQGFSFPGGVLLKGEGEGEGDELGESLTYKDEAVHKKCFARHFGLDKPLTDRDEW